jgi:2-polyprenyl-3-methyl-5-hydroxy-6-metoxy-1,4-benzoquinol methylase
MTGAPDRANGYEEHAETFVRWRHPRIGLEIVRAWAAQFGPEAEVLELGCGHGVVSQVLVDAGVTLYAVDASPTLLRSLRERLPAVRMECATAEESTFFARRFEGVIAVGLIFLLPEAAQRLVLTKAARTLKPGGRLLFTAPREACEWIDDLTGRPSRSLGAAEYERLLCGLGMKMAPGCCDEGENYYFFASRNASRLASKEAALLHSEPEP